MFRRSITVAGEQWQRPAGLKMEAVTHSARPHGWLMKRFRKDASLRLAAVCKYGRCCGSQSRAPTRNPFMRQPCMAESALKFLLALGHVLFKLGIGS